MMMMHIWLWKKKAPTETCAVASAVAWTLSLESRVACGDDWRRWDSNSKVRSALLVPRSADAQRAELSPSFPVSMQVGGKSHRALHPNRFAPDPSPRLRRSKQRTIGRRSPGRGPWLCHARVPDRPLDRRPEKKATRIASDRGHARPRSLMLRPALSASAPPPLFPSHIY